METRSIDWGSAEVAPAPPLFELRVRVAPDGVEDEWRARFNELAKRQALAAHRALRWGAIELVDETITVTGLQPEADADLKRTLDALAAETNTEVERERLRREEDERRRLEEEAERERVARELTHRFRSGAAVRSEPKPPPSPFRS